MINDDFISHDYYIQSDDGVGRRGGDGRSGGEGDLASRPIDAEMAFASSSHAAAATTTSAAGAAAATTTTPAATPAKTTTTTTSSLLVMDDANFDGVQHHHNYSRVDNFLLALKSIVGMLAVATMICSGLAVILINGASASGTGAAAAAATSSIVAYLCFGLTGLVVAPAVIVQRSLLQWEPTFRRVQNELRTKVNDVVEANHVLEQEIGRLQRQANRLAAVEERFQQICGRETKDIDHMKALVKANGAIQKEMKTLQAASEMQALMEAIMLADKDSNSFLSEKELDQVMLRLSVFAGTINSSSRTSSARFDEATIRAAFKHAMTHQGVALGRIHSHLQAQQEAEEAAAADGYMVTYGYPKDTGVVAPTLGGQIV